MKKNIRFIVNPVSGASWKRGDVESLLKNNLDYRQYNAEICFTNAPKHATELSKEASQRGDDIVVAVGGDGSVNEVASGLLGSNTAMGVLPAGSGNGYAMHIGVGRKMKKGIEILNTGKTHSIDTATLNGQPYINLSGVGFAASIAYEFKKSKRRGFINYFLISMKQAYSYQFQDYEISIDDGPYMDRSCLMVEVANSTSFGYNFKPAPLAVIDDGLLELVICNKRPKWRYFLSSPKLITGNIHKAEYLENFSCKKVKIRIPENSFVHMDGEGFIESNELIYEIHPKSLHVIVPNVS